MDLLERGGQLAAITHALTAAAAGDGSLLVVRGSAGTGKSALLDAAAELAGSQGFGVLTACGGELETGFAFGAARQLFERRLTESDRGTLLTGAAGLAARLLTEAPSDTEDTSFALLHGLYWLTANLAAETPVVLVVDDAHWVDRPTLHWLHYLGRRLSGVPVLVLLAARTGEPNSHNNFVDRLAALPGARMLGVDVLSAAATERLVRDGLPAATAATVRVCWTVTGGNPLYVKEIVRELAERQAAPDEIGEVGLDGISRLVLPRLARVGPGALELARAVAVLGGRATLRAASGLAGCSLADAVVVADALAAAGVFGTADPPAFTHPVVRAAIYADLPAAQRALAHGRAARVQRAAGAPAEEIAAHLMRSGPAGSRDAVEVLLDVGRRLLAGGAPELAEPTLARALVEPPGADQQAAILHLLGIAELRQAKPVGMTRLRDALPLCTGPAQTARLAQDLAYAYFLAADPTAGLELLDGVVDELRARDPDRALALDATGLLFARITPFAGHEALKRVDRLRPLLPRAGERPTAGQRLALATVAASDTHACLIDADRAARLARDALDGGALLAAESGDSGAPAVMGIVLLMADRFAEARAVFDAIVADGRRRASRPAYAIGLCQVAHTCLRTGELLDAESTARASLEAIEQPHPLVVPLQVAVLVDVLLDRGMPAEADAVLDTHGLAGPVASGYNDSFLLCSRGNLRLAQHRVEDALRDFRAAGQVQAECGLINPAAADWRSGAALALARLGRWAQARELAEENVALAMTFAAPRALGMALRARGLADPDLDAALHHLGRAAEVLHRSGARLEHARALADAGALLRRTNNRGAAKSTLLAALDLAERCRATGLVARISEELRLAGARPRRHARSGADALTPAERRVAQLAAEGLTNREIAQALFITIKTVEDHLSRTYTKLGIAGRTGLAAQLSPGR